MTNQVVLMKISQVDELFYEDFCPVHAYLCRNQIFCWQQVISQGDVVFCDEDEENPILYDRIEDEWMAEEEKQKS